MHAQTGSIISHHVNSHEGRPRTAEILEHVKILFRSHDKTELTLAEAILIKQISPTMNNQRVGETRVLRVFWHISVTLVTLMENSYFEPDTALSDLPNANRLIRCVLSLQDSRVGCCVWRNFACFFSVFFFLFP